MREMTAVNAFLKFQFYHPWMLLLMRSVASVCVFMCLSCSGSNSWQPWPRNFISGTQVHLANIWIKFVYEGHRVKVKVKVTGAKGHTHIRKWSAVEWKTILFKLFKRLFISTIIHTTYYSFAFVFSILALLLISSTTTVLLIVAVKLQNLPINQSINFFGRQSEM